MAEKEEAGPFATIFAIVGFFAGISFGVEQEMEGGPTFITALFMTAIGFSVGKFTDKLIAKVIFIISTLIMFLVNAAIRRFLWEMIQAVIG